MSISHDDEQDELLVDVIELDEVLDSLDRVKAAVYNRLGDSGLDEMQLSQYAFVYWIHLKMKGEL